jgi:hypothetical protein
MREPCPIPLDKLLLEARDTIDRHRSGVDMYGLLKAIGLLDKAILIVEHDFTEKKDNDSRRSA